MLVNSKKIVALILFSLTSVLSLQAQSHKKPIFGLSFSADGKYLYSNSLDGDGVKVWDVANKTFSHSFNTQDNVHLLPDGKSYLTISRNNELLVKVWDLETKKELRTIFYDEGIILSRRYAVSPDGKYLVCQGFDAHILLFDLTTGELLKKFGKREDESDILFHRNSQMFYLTEGKEVIAYDIKTLEAEIFPIEFNEEYNRLKNFQANFTVTMATFTGRKLGDTDLVRIYADNGKAIIESYNCQETTVNQVLMSPTSDETIVLVSTQVIKIINLKTKLHKNILTVDYDKSIYGKVSEISDKTIKRSISQVIFSPDGKTLAVGTGNKFLEGDKTDFWIYLIDVSTGKVIAQLNQK